MMESYGNWNFAYYYIDENANPGQRKALEAIAGAMLTPGVSKKTQTRYAPITRRIEGKEHQITIGHTAAFMGTWSKAHGWCAENCKPAGRGSAASPIRTRTHDKNDLQ